MVNLSISVTSISNISSIALLRRLVEIKIFKFIKVPLSREFIIQKKNMCLSSKIQKRLLSIKLTNDGIALIMLSGFYKPRKKKHNGYKHA